MTKKQVYNMYRGKNKNGQMRKQGSNYAFKKIFFNNKFH